MHKFRYLAIILISLSFLFPFSGFSKKNDIRLHPRFLSDNQDELQSIQNEALQQKIIEWLGTPYRGGSNTKSGTDCSGFVQMIFREVYNKVLTHSSREMIKEVRVLKKRSELQEGDLLFFKTEHHRVSHVGIYLKDGLFVHASTSKGVEIASLTMPYYIKTFYKAGRIMELY